MSPREKGSSWFEVFELLGPGSLKIWSGALNLRSVHEVQTHISEDIEWPLLYMLPIFNCGWCCKKLVQVQFKNWMVVQLWLAKVFYRKAARCNAITAYVIDVGSWCDKFVCELWKALGSIPRIHDLRTIRDTNQICCSRFMLPSKVCKFMYDKPIKN